MEQEIKEYWEKFLSTRSLGLRPEKFSAWSFGNTPEMADKLGSLVLNGPKRATTSLAWIYEKFTDQKMPYVGEISIVLGSQQNPLCIIETTSVEKRKFSEIDAKYAFTEGEGDRSLKHWVDTHWNYFSKECESVGRAPTLEMPVICEIFKLLYPVLNGP